MKLMRRRDILKYVSGDVRGALEEAKEVKRFDCGILARVIETGRQWKAKCVLQREREMERKRKHESTREGTANLFIVSR